MNTHRAVIESSVPPMLTLVGAGPKDFCEEYLATWISKHPLGEFEEGIILQVMDTVNDAAVERAARVLIEDGQFGVPWDDASPRDRGEAMDHARAVLEGK